MQINKYAKAFGKVYLVMLIFFLTEDFEAVGQNQYMKSIQKETTHADLKRAVEAWYEEIKYTSADIIKSFKL